MSEERIIISEDSNGNEVRVLVKEPTRDDWNDASIEYSLVLKKALDKKVYLRQDLDKKLKELGLWDEDKQAASEKIAEEINKTETKLNKGGLTLKEARKVAIELKNLRQALREIISIKLSFDEATAEGLAENARFDYMIAMNIFDPVSRQRKFNSVEEYNKVATQPWAIKAATEIANLYYKLSKNPEDSFLEKFKMVDSEGRLINKNGHLIDVDSEGVERLIDKEGYYIAYDSNGEVYNINRNCDKIEKIVTETFID